MYSISELVQWGSLHKLNEAHTFYWVPKFVACTMACQLKCFFPPFFFPLFFLSSCVGYHFIYKFGRRGKVDGGGVLGM